MRQLQTSTVPVIVRVLGMIKKSTDKQINKIFSWPSEYEIQKLNFAERREFYECSKNDKYVESI